MQVEASVENCNPKLEQEEEEDEEADDEEANGNKEQVRGKSNFKGAVSIISSNPPCKDSNLTGLQRCPIDQVRW